MRRTLILGLWVFLLPTPSLAEPNWTLLDEGAKMLGEARSWVETCESEQMDRFNGLLEHVRRILEDAGLREHEVFRFDAKLEASAQMAGGESGPDCENTDARVRIGEGVQMVNRGITPP